jgi:PiT family inorganic phosphate transporter
MGAGIAKGGLSIVLWNDILHKVVAPLVLSPLVGFVIAFLLMTLITYFFARSNPGKVGPRFKHLQLLSSAAMSFSHGQNDGQKTMGVITLALFSHHLIATKDVPLWVKLACATVMGLGTASGGLRIIHTVGMKILRLEPVQGFAAETAGAATIMTASALGMPVSTTHVISGSIFGVGAAKRLSAVRWQVAINMVSAWVITIPASGTVAAAVYLALHAFGVSNG